MNGSHVVLDHVLFLAVALASPLADRVWLYPRLRRLLTAGIRGARMHAYLTNVLVSWFFAGSVIALWAFRGRSWGALMLGPSTPWRLGLGFTLTAGYLGLVWAQWRAIVGRPDRLGLLADKFGSAEALMPRTDGERWGFSAVAITAGLSEELLFRGFITWYVGVWTGLAPAVAISVALFGFAHIYLGAAHVLRTAIAGLVFAVVVLLCGSLWPAIIIHAVQDLTSGDLGFRAFNKACEEGARGNFAAA